MITDDVKARLTTFADKIEMFYGRYVTISESISTNKANFDRHSSTFGNYELKLEKVTWRMCGGRITFSQADLYYEISIDNLVNFLEKERNCFEFLEQNSEAVFRMTTLKFKEL